MQQTFKTNILLQQKDLQTLNAKINSITQKLKLPTFNFGAKMQEVNKLKKYYLNNFLEYNHNTIAKQKINNLETQIIQRNKKRFLPIYK